jgi:mono/diheme cytochrome c family protein
MMACTTVRTIAVALALSAFACGKDEREAGQWPMSREELERGRPSEDSREATYRRYCIGCHGVDGKGNGGVTGADFTAANSPLRAKPDAELLISVRDGKRGATATMPAHKPVLSEAEIAGTLRYARERFAPDTLAPMQAASSDIGAARGVGAADETASSPAAAARPGTE